MKPAVAIFGAGGKIGAKLLTLLSTLQNFNVILIPSQSIGSEQRLKGMILDLQTTNCDLKIQVCSDYKIISQCDLIICCISARISQFGLSKFSESDPSGRLVQSFVNRDQIVEICQNIAKINSQVPFLMVTNQVEMLCQLARKYLKNVFGLTGLVDSERLRFVLKQQEYFQYFANISQLCNAQVVGYHNENMQILASSLPKALQSLEKLDEITGKFAKIGKEIMDLQKTGLKDQDQDCGASILPAHAIFTFVKLFLFGEKEVFESLNCRVVDQEIANCYGISANSDLSVVVGISQKQIRQVVVEVSETEKEHLRQSQQKLNQQVLQLMAHKPQKVIVIGKAALEILTENSQIRAVQVGGSAGNIAQSLAARGAEVTLVSSIGADNVGSKMLQDQLQRKGIKVVNMNAGFCQVSVGEIDESKGCEVFENYLNEASSGFLDYQKLIEGCDWIVIAGQAVLRADFFPDLEFKKLLNAIKVSQTNIFYDPNLRRPIADNQRFQMLIQCAKIIKISNMELQFIESEDLKAMKLKTLILTSKKKVEIIQNCDSKEVICPQIGLEQVVCTVGAGDSFDTAYLVSEQELIEDKVKDAIAAAQESICSYASFLGF